MWVKATGRKEDTFRINIYDDVLKTKTKKPRTGPMIEAIRRREKTELAAEKRKVKRLLAKVTKLKSKIRSLKTENVSVKRTCQQLLTQFAGDVAGDVCKTLNINLSPTEVASSEVDDAISNNKDDGNNALDELLRWGKNSTTKIDNAVDKNTNTTKNTDIIESVAGHDNEEVNAEIVPPSFLNKNSSSPCQIDSLTECFYCKLFIFNELIKEHEKLCRDILNPSAAIDKQWKTDETYKQAESTVGYDLDEDFSTNDDCNVEPSDETSLAEADVKFATKTTRVEPSDGTSLAEANVKLARKTTRVEVNDEYSIINGNFVCNECLDEHATLELVEDHIKNCYQRKKQRLTESGISFERSKKPIVVHCSYTLINGDFLCNVCLTKYPSKRLIERHVKFCSEQNKTSSEGNKPDKTAGLSYRYNIVDGAFVCIDCRESFYTKADFKGHAEKYCMIKGNVEDIDGNRTKSAVSIANDSDALKRKVDADNIEVNDLKNTVGVADDVGLDSDTDSNSTDDVYVTSTNEAGLKSVVLAEKKNTINCLRIRCMPENAGNEALGDEKQSLGDIYIISLKNFVGLTEKEGETAEEIADVKKKKTEKNVSSLKNILGASKVGSENEQLDGKSINFKPTDKINVEGLKSFLGIADKITKKTTPSGPPKVKKERKGFLFELRHLRNIPEGPPGSSPEDPLDFKYQCRRIGTVLICDLCHVHCRNKNAFLSHVKDDCPHPHFVCKICGVDYGNFRNLKSHLKNHRTVRDKICETCGLTFTTDFHLGEHVKLHSEETPYKCDDCDQAFKLRKYLLNHMRSAHKKGLLDQSKLKYPCVICPKKFTTENRLRVHKSKHNANVNHLCETCGIEYKSEVALKNHKTKRLCESTTKFLSLGGPSKNYESTKKIINRAKQKMYRERYKNSEEKFQCNICSKLLNSRANLKLHLDTHSTVKAYSCKFCGKTFKSYMGCNKHEHELHGEKKYPCEYCSLSFARTSVLRHHMKSHSQDRPFTCHCGKSFKYNGDLNSHCRKWHAVDGHY